jgi:hypothetical protein
MITLKPRHGLMAGLALILLSNAVALAGAWYNRQGEPESRLLLSERELRRPWGGLRQENSGLNIQLDWRMSRHEWSEEDPSCGREQGLTEAQMKAIGMFADDSRSRRETQQAWAVFELDGPAYQRSLQQAELQLQEASEKLKQLPDHKRLQEEEKSARRDLEDERLKESRLFLIDVGLDAQALRQRYPNRSQYALLRGTVNVWSSCQSSNKKRHLAGTVHLHNDSINVPHAWRQQLAKLLPEHYGNADQPFTAEISIGQRFEPWLSAVQITETSKRDDENGAPR